MHDHLQPTAELMLVTPELAEKWLGRNTNNRNIRDRKVNTYAAAMSSDDWIITGDGPKFDRTGRLINGQHTLLAVISSNASAWMFVFRNMPSDAQFVMDTGSKRSVADALKFAGITGCNLITLAAASRIGILWDEGHFARSSQSSFAREVTSLETIEWISANKDAIDACVQADLYRKRVPVPSSILGFAVMLTTRVDAEASLTFFADIAHMRTNGQGDPIYTMLRRYRFISEQKEKMSPARHLFYIFRTWNAWRDGDPLFQLKTGDAGAAGAIKIPEPK